MDSDKINGLVARISVHDMNSGDGASESAMK